MNEDANSSAGLRDFAARELDLAVRLLISCSAIHGYAELAGSAVPWLGPPDAIRDPLGSIGKYLCDTDFSATIIEHLPAFLARLAVAETSFKPELDRVNTFVGSVVQWRAKNAGKSGIYVRTASKEALHFTDVLRHLIVTMNGSAGDAKT